MVDGARREMNFPNHTQLDGLSQEHSTNGFVGFNKSTGYDKRQRLLRPASRDDESVDRACN